MHVKTHWMTYKPYSVILSKRTRSPSPLYQMSQVLPSKFYNSIIFSMEVFLRQPCNWSRLLSGIVMLLNRNILNEDATTFAFEKLYFLSYVGPSERLAGGEDSFWYRLHPSTCSVLWEICLQHCIFWRQQIGPFALRALISVIHGMRNFLGNDSPAFEFNFHFYFWQLSCSFSRDFAVSFRNLTILPRTHVLQDILNQTFFFFFFFSVRNKYYTSEQKVSVWEFFQASMIMAYACFRKPFGAQASVFTLYTVGSLSFRQCSVLSPQQSVPSTGGSKTPEV